MCRYVTTTVHQFALCSNQQQSEQLFRSADPTSCLRRERPLGWRRSARRHAFQVPPLPSRPPVPHAHARHSNDPIMFISLTTTPNATHFHHVSLRGIASMASRFLGPVPPKRRRSTSSHGPLHHQSTQVGASVLSFRCVRNWSSRGPLDMLER